MKQLSQLEYDSILASYSCKEDFFKECHLGDKYSHNLDGVNQKLLDDYDNFFQNEQ
jgi:hypothetical protein